MILENGSKQYLILEKDGKLDPVAVTLTYRVYICEDVSTGKSCLLQIATEVAHNGGLDRAAYVLGKLRDKAEEFEAENAKINPDRPVSYDRLFPVRVDSFIAAEQGGRRVNILAITEVDDVADMVPLSNLIARDRLRVSLASSAWIMGRLLKLLAFAHEDGIAVRVLAGGNILLEPERHFAVVFDWSSALLHQGEVPAKIRKIDISNAARAVLECIGVDLTSGENPYNKGEDPRYVEFLWRLANGREGDAYKAHTKFYELVDDLWGRKFRPFETLPL